MMANIRLIRSKTLDFLLLAVIVGAFALLPGDTHALADPDTIRIESVTRYDDTARAGDMFILVEYTLLYSVAPAESISEGWLGRLLDVDGSGQLASIQPFSGGGIPALGYDRGAYGFYFAVEPAITGTLRVTLEGNPTLSPTPTGIFTETITQRSASDAAPDLRAMALRFEDPWDTDLVSPISGGVNRYTEFGEEYFSSALPNLRNVAPDMFVLQSSQVAPPDREFDTEYTDARRALFDGTPVATGLASGAVFLNMSETMFRFLVALTLGLIAAFMAGRMPGVAGESYASTFQIWAIYLVFMGGFWVGLVNAQTLGVLTVLAIMATATVFYLQRTNA